MLEKRKECIRFGKIVRQLREKKKLSQETFAERVDIHRTYVGGIERGERNPTLTMIYRIAAALAIHPSNLLK